MPADTKLATFVEEALAAGMPLDVLTGLLVARGWQEKEIYEALGQHYRQLTGIEIPSRTGAGASARDAFYYLLMFATLATWTVAFACLAFTLIDRLMADPLFARAAFDSYGIPSYLATILVSFPLYLAISRAVAKESAAQPEKLESPVREWLTYMALVIAAGVFMGDLIAALTYLLRGECTARFVAKAAVVLALSGGVFFYYFGGLRRTEIASPPRGRDRFMAALSTAAVCLIVALAFLQTGTPGRQREAHADAERSRQLFQLATEIKSYWEGHDKKLPESLGQVSAQPHQDPVTHALYEYRPGQDGRYELCATFDRASDPQETRTVTPTPWVHPAGRHCFLLDATGVLRMPALYP